MTGILAVLALPILAVVAHDFVRRPTIRRLAIRNVGRRKGEAALVIAGSMLGTAIITASFVVGDTLGASIRDGARTELGPIDEVVRVAGLERHGQAQAALSRPVAGTDGVLSMVTAAAAVATPGPDRRAEPNATLIEVDFERARRFGGDPAATGLKDAGATPQGDDVVVVEDLAKTLGVGPGDTVEAHAYGSTRRLRVRDVVRKLGVAGFSHPGAFVAPGTIAPLAESVVASGSSPPAGLVAVSNHGGVFDGAKRTPEVRRALEERLGRTPGIEVQTLKQDLLEDADAAAGEFTELFAGIGAFSVIAGILLLVNIFVMLAEERKGELGTLRALGLKRNQLVRTFGAEGAIYSLLASLAGAVVGIGVGRVVVVVAQDLFNAGEEDDFRVALRFTAEFPSLVSGFVIGGVIALLTAWITSARIGRLNVIRAIRELPEPAVDRRRPAALALGTLGVVAGGILAVSGIASRSWFGALVGPPLVAVSLIPLLGRIIARRLVVSGACAAALVWGIFAFSLLPRVFEGSDIPTFVVQGIILVASAVALGAVNADLIGRGLTRVLGPGRSLAARLAFAYPMARRFRTSMLLGMYALVTFVLTFLAVFSKLFDAQAPRFTEEARAGFDLVVDSNPANPATINTLFNQPEVQAVAPIVRGLPRWRTEFHPEPELWPVSGFDETFLTRGFPVLGERESRFRDDREVWRTVLRSPELVVVSDFFLQEAGGPPEGRLHPGDQVELINPQGGDRRMLTVAGVMASDWLQNGGMVGAPLVREFLGAEAVSNRHFVALEPGQDAELAAARLTGRLVEYGVDADTVASLVEFQLEQQEGFLRLMRGYLALGLLVGIAGLGVVMVRAVRERRRQIGMLRAMGFSSRVVRAAFLLEAAFIAVQGIVVGVALALVVAYQLVVNSDVFGEQRLDFTVPWGSLAVLLTAALAASLAATATPATQASRIRPAVALRIAE